MRSASGKRLEPAPTVLKINFEYCVNVNVDSIIYDQAWIIPRSVCRVNGRARCRTLTIPAAAPSFLADVPLASETI